MAGIMGMAVAVAAAVMAVSAAARPAVQVTFLSIGQGDCSVARFADGRVMVVDAGPEASSETLLAYCRRQRISVIDALVLSHGHADHGGGMKALLREFEVKRIFMSGPEDAILAAEIEEAAGQKGVSVTRLWAGDVFEIGGARVSVVWPRPDGEALWRENRNDYSLVMSLEAGNCSFIFTGDVEYDAESLIMESACGCDVLKIPHHGSAGAGSEAWLRTLAPELAVISVGRNNYGHPSDRVLDILDGIGSRTIVTLWDGAAVITCDGSRCSVSEWKGPWGLKN
jgi:competence protein ComEC